MHFSKITCIACLSVLFSATVLGQNFIFAENLKSNNGNEISTSRSPYELMQLITNKIMHEVELKEGEYIRGDWSAVKKSTRPEIMPWLYPTGVSMLAMQRVFSITHDKKIMKYVNDNIRISTNEYAYLRWQKMKFGTVFKPGELAKLWRLDMLDDYGAISASILEGKLRHQMVFTDHVNELINITENYIRHVQYRLNDGTLWRPNSPDGPTIWADDLFMGLPFLIRLSEYKNDPSLLDDAVRQIINYAKLLQDKDGVWRHAYFIDKKSPNCCKWGRANGWVAVAIAEVLSVLPKSHPKYQLILDICKKQIDGLIKLQAPSGLWNQVLDHPELSWGTETSCSAQFTYAIARGINRGWLNSSYIPVVKKSLNALSDTSRISVKGDILKVCASTSIGKNLDYYNSVPVENILHTDHHGDGLVLLALTEMYELLKNTRHNKK